MTSQYKTYPEYKNSGVQWIGKIPEGWEVHKVKHYKKDVKFSIVDGPFGTQLHSEEYVDEGIPVVRVINLTYNGDFVSKNMVFIRKEKYSELKRSSIKEGDILIAKTGATIGKIGVFSGFKKAIILSSCLKLSLKDKINHDFFKYLLISDSGQSQILSEAAGSTRDTINIDSFSNLCFSIPNKIEEQQKIAFFLDKKIANVNALVEKDKKLIGLLKEKRAALINHAVTKGLPVRGTQTGLESNAKMKDSGIDWIGKIPEGWEVKKLKFSVYEKKIKDTTKNPNTKFIGLEHIESETGKLISSSTLEDIDGESVRFKENNVLFGKLRPYLAKVIKVDFRGSCTGELIVYEARGKIDSKFLFYRLLSKGFIDLVNSTTYGVKMPRADPTQLSNIKIAWPPLPEQTTIVNFLGKATVKMDKTIQKIEQKIKFLEEYKKSLIHHAVTGKIDVRGPEI